MNKTKMILIGIGGGVGLLVLVAAYFAWSAFSDRTIATEGDYDGEVTGFDSVMSEAQQLSRKKIYPCAASLREIESNRTVIVEWTKEATKLATRGDRAFPSTTPAQFKTDMVNEAQRLRALPGRVTGKLTKPDFAFGPFKEYVAGGSMPKDSELPELQRKWDDVVTVVETIAACGIAELTDIQFKAAEEGKEEIGKRNQKGKAKKPARNAKGAKKDAAEANAPKDFSYVISFTSRPAALVKVLNALVVCERFVTVDALTFARPKDAVASAFGEDEKKQEASGGRRGRRGRRGGAEASAPESDGKDKSKNRIVTDPQLDEPMSVVLTVTVSDFNSLNGEGASK